MTSPLSSIKDWCVLTLDAGPDGNRIRYAVAWAVWSALRRFLKGA
jgi:hypothetical protein